MLESGTLMPNKLRDHLYEWFEVYFYLGVIILAIALILGLGMLKCGSAGIDHWETRYPCWGCKAQPVAVCRIPER